MLDLAPQTESLIQEYAAREGVSPDEAIVRLFKAATTAKNEPRPAVVDNPVLRLLEAQLREAETATPEEVTAANEAYRQWQHDIDEPRRINGERLLFPQVEP